MKKLLLIFLVLALAGCQTGSVEIKDIDQLSLEKLPLVYHENFYFGPAGIYYQLSHRGDSYDNQWPKRLQVVPGSGGFDVERAIFYDSVFKDDKSVYVVFQKSRVAVSCIDWALRFEYHEDCKAELYDSNRREVKKLKEADAPSFKKVYDRSKRLFEDKNNYYVFHSIDDVQPGMKVLSKANTRYIGPTKANKGLYDSRLGGVFIVNEDELYLDGIPAGKVDGNSFQLLEYSSPYNPDIGGGSCDFNLKAQDIKFEYFVETANNDALGQGCETLQLTLNKRPLSENIAMKSFKISNLFVSDYGLYYSPLSEGDDKTRVFVAGSEDFDPSSYKKLGRRFFKDKSAVYLRHLQADPQGFLVRKLSADVHTFSLIAPNSNFAEDKEHYYWFTSKGEWLTFSRDNPFTILEDSSLHGTFVAANGRIYHEGIYRGDILSIHNKTLERIKSPYPYFKDDTFLYCYEPKGYEEKMRNKELTKLNACVLDGTCPEISCDDELDWFDQFSATALADPGLCKKIKELPGLYDKILTTDFRTLTETDQDWIYDDVNAAELCVFEDQEFVDSWDFLESDGHLRQNLLFTSEGLFMEDLPYYLKIEGSEDFDVETVEIINSSLFKDKSAVYYLHCEGYGNCYFSIIPGADPVSFAIYKDEGLAAKYEHFDGVFPEAWHDDNNYYIHNRAEGVKAFSKNLDLKFHLGLRSQGELRTPAMYETLLVKDGTDYYVNGVYVGLVDGDTFNSSLLGAGGYAQDKNYSYCTKDFSEPFEPPQKVLYKMNSYEASACGGSCCGVPTDEMLFEKIRLENPMIERGWEVAFPEDYAQTVFYDSNYHEHFYININRGVSKNGDELAKVDVDSFEQLFPNNHLYFQDKDYLYCLEGDRILRKERSSVDACVEARTCSLPPCETRFDKFDSIPD